MLKCKSSFISFEGKLKSLLQLLSLFFSNSVLLVDSFIAFNIEIDGFRILSKYK